MKYRKLTINDPSELVFGRSPFPVTTRRGLVIGGGTVYPELNFTLPPMKVNMDTLPTVRQHYRDIVKDSLDRALALHSEGLVFEFEALLEMTRITGIGVEVVRTMNEICEDYFQRYGIKSEIRLTPNDLREFERPPRQRSSELLGLMLELFERGAEAGGDLLSIESTGGKEISDDALMMCDIRLFLFSQAVLGTRDMRMLWSRIVGIAHRYGKIPAGDTACGFGNTAMVLAEKNFIPRIFAAVARVITVVRTLVSIEEGATGPDKDCGYEGPYLKAITGIPISMEGKTSACAHYSPVGNVSAACADLWSNESVQNIRLLAGPAPTVYLEQLQYDARLMNQASRHGKDHVRILQQLLVESDIFLDPQALVLAPENVISISSEIVAGNNYIEAAVRGAMKALSIIEEAVTSGQLSIAEREREWIGLIRDALLSIPCSEDQFISEMIPFLDSGKVILSEYGI